MSCICIFDTETTGVGSEDQALELASLIILNGEIVDQKRWLANPGVPIKQKAQETHGYSDEMVKDYPSIQVIAKGWLDWLVKVNEKFPVTLCAHNAAFDLRMLEKQVPQVRSFPVLCTMRMARRFVPLSPKHTVTFLYEYFGFTEEMQAHTALDDCRMTAAILGKLLAMSNMSVPELVESQKSPKPLEITPIGNQKGKKFDELTDSHILYFSKLDDLDPDLRCTVDDQMQRRNLY